MIISGRAAELGIVSSIINHQSSKFAIATEDWSDESDQQTGEEGNGGNKEDMV